MRFVPAIGFEYRPSRLPVAVVVALSALALLAVTTSGVPSLLKMALVIWMLGYGAHALWRHWHPRVRALNWRGDGGVSIALSNRGTETEVQGALQGARVLGPLITLQLRWPHGSASLWLLPDNLDVDARRRLRMRLALDGPRPSVDADSV